MTRQLLTQQRNMGLYLLIHIVLAILLPIFVKIYEHLVDYIIAFFVVAIVLSIVNRHYGRYLVKSTIFLIYLFKEIIVSNLILAWIILRPNPKLDPGIIAIPLTVTTGLEITILSLAIAATPGTLIVELKHNSAGENTLYVHTINVGDPEKFRATIKNGFERMILQISRGATA